MKVLKKEIIFIMILLIMISCKPFDSNNYNMKLLQGEWYLKSISSKSQNKQVKIDDPTSLNFEEDICIESFQDTPITNKYHVDVKNYMITLTDSAKNTQSKFLLSKLVKDSLILENDVYIYKYTSRTDN